MSSAAAFRAFEHSGWEASVSAYDRYFGPLTSATTEALLAAVDAGPGKKLLDVATGPGYVAIAAQQRGCDVEGIDFSLAMIEVAQRNSAMLDSGIVFRVGDAEELPYEDASFDAVVMNFGVLHLSRPEQAFAEARRVLRDGGRFAFTVWAPPSEARGFALMLAAIEQAGDMNVALPAGPPFFRFSDAAECERTLVQAGFGEIEVTKLPLLWRVPDADALYDAFHQGTARTGGLLRAQKPEASAAIRARVGEMAREFERGGTLEIPMPAVLVRGERE